MTAARAGQVHRIEEGLQLRLRKAQAPAKRVRLPVYDGQGGLVAGLDALSNRALLAAAAIHQGEQVTSFDADFKRLLPRSQFVQLPA